MTLIDLKQPPWILNRLTGGIAEEQAVNTHEALKAIYEGVGRDFSGLYLLIQRWNKERNRYDYTAINTNDGKDRVRRRIQTTFGFLPTPKALDQGIEMYKECSL